MLLCPICWNQKCNCHTGIVEIDDEISDIICNLNRKGYKTMYCCGGHIDPEWILLGCVPRIYIMFSGNYFSYDEANNIGERWKYIKYNHVIECSIKEAIEYKIFYGKTEYLKKKYNQPLTEEVIAELEGRLEYERNLLSRWVDNLPDIKR